MPRPSSGVEPGSPTGPSKEGGSCPLAPAFVGRSVRPTPREEVTLVWFVPKLLGLQSEDTTVFLCFIHFIHTFLQL